MYYQCCIYNCRTRLQLVSHWNKERHLKMLRVMLCVDYVSCFIVYLLLSSL